VRFDISTASMPVVAVAMRVGSGWQFALNALTFVSELVNEVGRLARPRVVRVGDFLVVEASCRASLVRVGTWLRRIVERASCESERGRGVFVRCFGSSRFCGQSFSRGFVFLDPGLWVPLVLVPDKSVALILVEPCYVSTSSLPSPLFGILH
jgi:hypothetical protein